MRAARRRWMRRPPCAGTATPSARLSRSRTAWRGASRWRASPTCAARPSCGREAPEGWFAVDSTSVDEPGTVERTAQSLHDDSPSRWPRRGRACSREDAPETIAASPQPAPATWKKARNRCSSSLPYLVLRRKGAQPPRERTCDPAAQLRAGSRPTRVLYAHANRGAAPARLDPEARAPWCRRTARALPPATCWSQPPPIPLTTAEMDRALACPCAQPAPQLRGRARRLRGADQIRRGR